MSNKSLASVALGTCAIFSLVTCSHSEEGPNLGDFTKYGHRIQVNKSDSGVVGYYMDETTTRSVSMLDFDGDGKYDLIRITDKDAKKLTIIFWDNSQVIVVINTENSDSRKWTGKIIYDNDKMYECKRGAGGAWFFNDLNSNIKYIHMSDVKGGYRIDGVPGP